MRREHGPRLARTHARKTEDVSDLQPASETTSASVTPSAAEHATGQSAPAGSLWLNRARYKAFAYVGAIAIAAFATISFVGLPALPVVGVAVAAAAVTVSRVTARLAKPTCMSCGQDLKDQPVGTHGVACPGCGAVNSPTLMHLARFDTSRRTRADASRIV